jgi:hypothetical protein
MFRVYFDLQERNLRETGENFITRIQVEVFWVDAMWCCGRIPTFQRSMLRTSSGRDLLDCDAVYSCVRIQTFQRSMLPTSSGWSGQCGRTRRQHGPLKRWYPTTTLHGVTTQKTSTRFFIAVMKTSTLACIVTGFVIICYLHKIWIGFESSLGRWYTSAIFCFAFRHACRDLVIPIRISTVFVVSELTVNWNSWSEGVIYDKWRTENNKKDMWSVAVIRNE